MAARPRARSASPLAGRITKTWSLIGFKPTWTRHRKGAPFKCNGQMLDVLSIGVMVFPDTGIRENLAYTAKKLGIPVCSFK